MAAIKDLAIVLRRLDYSETSQVLVFLTREHGQRRLIAKGIKRSTRKKFAAGIDLLECGEVVFVAPTSGTDRLGTLTEWRQRDAHMGLRADLQRLYAAQYAAEVAAAMSEEADPHPEMYDALAGLLASLASEAAPLAALAFFQCDLLQAAGLWPDLTRCVACGKAAPRGRAGYYSALQGGLICRDCEPTVPEKRKVAGGVLDGLRDRAFNAKISGPAFDVLNYALSHNIGKEPTTSRYLTRQKHHQ